MVSVCQLAFGHSTRIRHSKLSTTISDERAVPRIGLSHKKMKMIRKTAVISQVDYPVPLQYLHFSEF